MYGVIKRIHFEITDKCNAACPQCIRTNIHTGSAQPWLLKRELTITDIKSMLSPQDIQYLEYVNFCGNYGDPLAANDLLEIVQYLFAHNANMMIRIHTNGSLRDEDWWWQMCSELHGHNLVWTFGIDGINQAQHELYRVNTNFNKIMTNAQMCIDAGFDTEWQYLVFAHNEHDVATAKQISQDMGFKEFLPVATERFWTGDTMTYKKRDGSAVTLSQSQQFPNTIQQQSKTKKVDCINCFAQQLSEVYINCMGIACPCCYLGIYMYAHMAGLPRDFHNKQEMMDMMSALDYDNLNAVKHGITHATQNEWFTQLTQMHKQMKPQRCVDVCGSKYNIKEYLNV